MPVRFWNFAYSFKNTKGKPVFVPTAYTRRIAGELKPIVTAAVDFERHYYHFAKGAHIAALHAHRENRFFGRIDLRNFFYSVGRNRVKAALQEIGVPCAEHYAKWSTVRNPYDGPRYSLPYGFPQSPLLATLVLRRSALGIALDALPGEIMKSIYLDDIAVSSNDLGSLSDAFEQLKAAVGDANFDINDDKTREPSDQIDLFNCDLRHGSTTVQTDRVEAFYARDPTPRGIAAFEGYREKIADGNR